MKLVIEFDVENDSVQTAHGLSAVMDGITRSIVASVSDATGVLYAISRGIKDENGNTIGRWKVVEGKVEA